MTAEIIGFPEGGRPRKWSAADRERLPIILILPVVRIELDDGTEPLLSPRQTRRCRKAIDKLRGARARQVIVDDLQS